MTRLNLTEAFVSLLHNNEQWLAERAKLYFSNTEFLDYSSSIQISAEDLNEALVQTIGIYGINAPELHPKDSYTEEPVSEFGIQLVRKHRDTGHSLSLLLGLLKYHRQAYEDLIEISGMYPEEVGTLKYFISRCFDRIELGAINEWQKGQNPDTVQAPASAENSPQRTDTVDILSSIQTPVFYFDDRNIIHFMNPRAKELIGIKGLTGKDHKETLQILDNLGSIGEQFYSFCSNQTTELTTESTLSIMDRQKHYRTFFRKLINEEEIQIGTVLMLEDITELKKVISELEISRESAVESDRLKTAFLANMSHEIRTPMNAILGFTELLINGHYQDEERNEYLQLIRRSSGDLLNIIEDIIDIAKLESNQLKIKYKPCKPYEILENLNAVFRETLHRYDLKDKVQLILNVDIQDQELLVSTDGERLKQVMANLLNNAVKFTEEGYIEFGYRRINNSHLYFYVRDSGAGIPEGMQDRIFDRFLQLDDNLERNTGGAGLGLAICKNIVELLNGKIWVDSKPGVGSDFYFQLPIHEIPRSETMQFKSVEVERPEIEASLRNKTILVAEDDEINFMYISELLSPLGTIIHRATNGLEAINLAESVQKIDMILMDIKMPEVDGLEATQYIKNIFPNLPIVALTAYAMDGDKAKCIQAGCDDYLTKPVVGEQLLQTLKRFLVGTESEYPVRATIH